MRTETTPFYLPAAQDNASGHESTAIRLAARDSNETYTEAWLQSLIYENPALLPASAIEPAFDRLLPVCRELPCPSGYLDNLYVTPDGGLVLVECKLWRNPEARRKVIAQIMDYAKDFAAWDYDALSQAVNRANDTTAENPLFDIVRDAPEAPDEITFTDRVSRNLRLGRHLLLIAGDGIRENMESLAEHVQKHAGLHFTLGLVEMRLFKIPDQNGVLVIPAIITRTTNIERAVIRLDGDGMSIYDAPTETRRAHERGQTLSEVQFFERLAENTGEGAAWLKKLLPALEAHGVSWEVMRSLILRYSPDGEHKFSLGYIETNGCMQLGQATWELSKIGREDIGMAYLENIAALVPGASVKLYDNSSPAVMVDGKTLRLVNLAGKDTELLKVISTYIADIRQAMS